MKKKQYMKPEQRVVMLQHRVCLMATSVTDITSPFDYGGGSSGPARSRDFDFDEWDE